MIIQRAPDPPLDPALLKAAHDAGIFTTNLQDCLVCHQDHQGVTTSTFPTPIVQGSLLGPDRTFTHWATCPETGEQLFIEFVPTDDIIDMAGDAPSLPPGGTT